MTRRLARNICMLLCLVLAVVALVMPANAVLCDHEYVDTVCTKCGKIGGECGGELTWAFVPEEGLLRISGSGTMTNYTKDFPAPWYPYRSQIKEVLVGGSVKSLGDYAFSECTELVTINIPNAVSNIYTSTFEKCYSLETFELDKKPNYSLDEKGVIYNKKYTYLIALPGTFQGECYIPDTVVNVGPNAAGNPFRFIKGVTKIVVDENNTTFSSTEEGLLFDKEQTQLIIVPRSYVGDCTMFGPNVVIATAGHPIDPELRSKGLQYNLPVQIGKNCWLGAGVIVMPGVTIGDNTVIGAGSIVTKDIPSNVVAVGNPCRVLREVGQRDREYYYKDRKIDPAMFDYQRYVLPHREDVFCFLNVKYN